MVSTCVSIDREAIHDEPAPPIRPTKRARPRHVRLAATEAQKVSTTQTSADIITNGFHDGSPIEDVSSAWREHATELAAWVDHMFVNRRDCWGGYNGNG